MDYGNPNAGRMTAVEWLNECELGRASVVLWRLQNLLKRWRFELNSMADQIEDSDDTTPFFDGGDTGCGELLLDLLLFIKKHPDGSVIRVRALDPGAPLEIPAWCRLTKNKLLESEHPIYKIRKSEFEGDKG